MVAQTFWSDLPLILKLQKSSKSIWAAALPLEKLAIWGGFGHWQRWRHREMDVAGIWRSHPSGGRKHSRFGTPQATWYDHIDHVISSMLHLIYNTKSYIYIHTIIHIYIYIYLSQYSIVLAWRGFANDLFEEISGSRRSVEVVLMLEDYATAKTDPI